MTTDTDRRGTTAVLFAADETARAHPCGFGGTNPDHTPGCARPVQWVVYPGQRFTCARHHLDALPTITSGQTGNLKYDDGRTRVWLERTTTADGEPYDRTATVETCHDGRWTVWERIDADNPGDHRTSRAFVDVDTLDALRATGLVPVWEVAP